jgi:uncharacterized protein (DUF305 family)
MTNTTQIIVATVIFSLVVISIGVFYTYNFNQTQKHTPNNMMNYNSSIMRGNNMIHGTGDSNMMMGDSMMMSVPNVVDDKTFIEYVIPHHQDAVDNSQTVLKFTKDPELVIFLNNVINTQSSEIVMLKSYYKNWFGTEYIDTYSKPIQRYAGMTSIQSEKNYIEGMLSHHSGIIDVAKMVLVDSKFQYKPEIMSLSKNIIKDQESDKVTLNKWLDEKYQGVETANKGDNSNTIMDKYGNMMGRN